MTSRSAPPGPARRRWARRCCSADGGWRAGSRRGRRRAQLRPRRGHRAGRPRSACAARRGRWRSASSAWRSTSSTASTRSASRSWLGRPARPSTASPPRRRARVAPAGAHRAPRRGRGVRGARADAHRGRGPGPRGLEGHARRRARPEPVLRRLPRLVRRVPARRGRARDPERGQRARAGPLPRAGHPQGGGVHAALAQRCSCWGRTWRSPSSGRWRAWSPAACSRRALQLRFSEVLERGSATFPPACSPARSRSCSSIVVAATLVPAARAGRVPASQAIARGAAPVAGDPRGWPRSRSACGCGRAHGRGAEGRRGPAAAGLAGGGDAGRHGDGLRRRARDGPHLRLDRRRPGAGRHSQGITIDSGGCAREGGCGLSAPAGVQTWFTATERQAAVGSDTFQLRALGGDLAGPGTSCARGA